MAELYSQYASGAQFPAGDITGSSTGASGLNPIVDRLNAITSDDGAYSNLTAGEGIDISAGSVISAELATTSNKGVASFATADFGVSSGAVSLDDDVISTIDGDTGTATGVGHSINILGGEGIDVTGGTPTGDDLTIAGESASTTNKGVVELATIAETSAGTDITRALTASGLAGAIIKTTISGTTSAIFISGGQINKVPSASNDIVNKTYSDSQLHFIKRSFNQFTGGYVSGTLIGSVSVNPNRPLHLNIFNYTEGAGSIVYRLAKMYNGTKENEIDKIFVIGANASLQYSNHRHLVTEDDLYAWEYERTQNTSSTSPEAVTVIERVGAHWPAAHTPTHIGIYSAGSIASNNNFGVQVESWQV